MRFMILVKANTDYEGGGMSSAEQLAVMAEYHEQLAKAGVLLDANGLQPSSAGWRIRHSGGRRTVIDGPFAETRELVVGFSIWEVKDMDEALAWAKRAPNPTGMKGEMEIRPFYEAADLAEFMTPEELAAPREGERGRLGVA